MQKKFAPSLLISRLHACLAGIPLAGALPVFGGSGRDPWLKEVLLESGAIPMSTAESDPLNHWGAVNLPDRDVASV